MSKRVLITGGTGFVGSHAAEEYLKAGWIVRAAVRDPNRLSWLKNMNVEIAAVSFSDRASLETACRDCDTVVHCAGLTKTHDRSEFYRVNAEAVETFTLAASGVGVHRFILCSTQAVAGPSRGGKAVTEADEARPVSDYGRSKLEGEALLMKAAGSMQWIILRPPIIMGPRDEQFVPFFRAICRQGIYPVMAGGRQRYSVIGVRDFAGALLVAGETQAQVNQVYFCAGRELLNWPDAARRIAAIAGRKAYGIRVGTPILKVAGFMGEWWANRRHIAPLVNRDKITELLSGDWICDSGKIERAWSFVCRDSLDDVLRLTYTSYRESGKL